VLPHSDQPKRPLLRKAWSKMHELRARTASYQARLFSRIHSTGTGNSNIPHQMNPLDEYFWTVSKSWTL
jgi:hypothetical protein